jgi:hypothetical protein
MASKYSEDEHRATVSMLRNILVHQAREGRLITYGELCRRAQSAGAPIPVEPFQDQFHQMLYEISASEDSAGRGILTALVVGEEERLIGPGKNFVPLMAELGRDVRNPQHAWIHELMKVARVWVCQMDESKLRS